MSLQAKFRANIRNNKQTSEFSKDRLENVGAVARVGGRIFGFPIDLAHRTSPDNF